MFHHFGVQDVPDHAMKPLELDPCLEFGFL